MSRIATLFPTIAEDCTWGAIRHVHGKPSITCGPWSFSPVTHKLPDFRDIQSNEHIPDIETFRVLMFLLTVENYEGHIGDLAMAVIFTHRLIELETNPVSGLPSAMIAQVLQTMRHAFRRYGPAENVLKEDVGLLAIIESECAEVFRSLVLNDIVYDEKIDTVSITPKILQRALLTTYFAITPAVLFHILKLNAWQHITDCSIRLCNTHTLTIETISPRDTLLAALSKMDTVWSGLLGFTILSPREVPGGTYHRLAIKTNQPGKPFLVPLNSDIVISTDGPNIHALSSTSHPQNIKYGTMQWGYNTTVPTNPIPKYNSLPTYRVVCGTTTHDLHMSAAGVAYSISPPRPLTYNAALHGHDVTGRPRI